MALDVKVNITATRPINKAGFGIPLILEGKTTQAVAYKECTSLAEVITAGFATTTAVYKAASLIFMQDNAPEKVAVCATTGTVTDFLTADNLAKNWRQLIVTSLETEGESTIAQIITAIEATDDKMFFVGLDTTDETSLTVTNINRTVLFYVDGTTEAPNPEAALVGATAGRAVGSFTYKNLILTGILPQTLTDSEITAIHNKGGITFVTKSGDNVTSEGKTAGGEYIDIIDAKDYIITQLVYQTQKMLNSTPKIPYDNNGIAMLETVAANVLKDAYDNGIVAANEDGSAGYSIDYAMREDTTVADRADRKYLGGKFSFVLAGAIHTVVINGEIEF